MAFHELGVLGSILSLLWYWLGRLAADTLLRLSPVSWWGATATLTC